VRFIPAAKERRFHTRECLKRFNRRKGFARLEREFRALGLTDWADAAQALRATYRLMTAPARRNHGIGNAEMHGSVR
jgi:hypothetical protein